MTLSVVNGVVRKATGYGATVANVGRGSVRAPTAFGVVSFADILFTPFSSLAPIGAIGAGVVRRATGLGDNVGASIGRGVVRALTATNVPNVGMASIRRATAFGTNESLPVGTGKVRGVIGFGTNTGFQIALNLGFGQVAPLLASSQTHMTFFGSGSGVTRKVSAFSTNKSLPVGVGTVRKLSALGLQQSAFAGAVFAMQSPGVLFASGDGFIVIGNELFSFTSKANASSVYVLAESLGFGDNTSELLTALQKVSASVDVIDALTAFYKLLVSSGFTLGYSTSVSHVIALQLIDALRMTAGIGTTTTAFHVVASAIALHSLLVRVYPGTLTDSVAFHTALTETRTTLLLQLATVTLHASVSDTATFAAIVADTFAIEDATTAFRTALLQASDALGIGVTLTLGDSVYYAWVVNTRNKAFSQYENYPFNSFCEFDGRYFGMAQDGIYELKGANDNGTPIQSRVRMGLHNLGTGKLKRLPAMYLGYTSSGQLVLKVTTTSPDGNKTENWYELAPQTANVAREGRIKIGRGLKSVYFDFTLTNVSGSSFALDKIDLFPIILDRRITGASNG